MLAGFGGAHTHGAAGPANLLFSSIFTAAAWAAGRTMRRYDERAAELRRTLLALDEEQAVREDAAVEAECARIALEMHDVVAHAVSSMVVQVGSTRMKAVTGEDRQRLRAAEETGRAALVELRRTLGLLGGSDTELQPLPGLIDVGALVADFRQAGLDVRAALPSGRAVLPSAGLTAYRILQEALTNALKHGDGGTVEVTVNLLDDDLHLCVVNAVGGAGPLLPSSGHGLAGMRERVSLFSGTLRAEAHGGMYVVEVFLPAATGDAAT